MRRGVYTEERVTSSGTHVLFISRLIELPDDLTNLVQDLAAEASLKWCIGTIAGTEIEEEMVIKKW